MLFDFTGINAGVVTASPFFWIKVSGGEFRVNGASIDLPNASGRSVQWSTWLPNTNMNPIFWPLFDKDRTTPKTFSNSATGANIWTLISDPITVNPSDLTFSFDGSVITVQIYAAYSSNLELDPTNDSGQLISSQDLDFSGWNGTLPVPIAPRWNARDGVADAVIPSKFTNRPDPGSSNFVTPETRATNWAYIEIAPNIANPTGTFSPEILRDTNATVTTRTIPYAYLDNTGSKLSPNFENRVKSLSGRNTTVFRAENTNTDLTLATVDAPFLEGVPLITPYDTVISMVLDSNGAGNGDPRLSTAGNASFKRIDQVITGIQPDTVFRTTPSTPGGAYYPRATARAQYHALGTPGTAGPMSTGYRQNQLKYLPSNSPMAQSGRSGWLNGTLGNGTGLEGIVGGTFTVENEVDGSWDWTMTPGMRMDGGFLSRPDQDYQTLFLDFSDNAFVGTPYFLRYTAYGTPGTNYFSPNRQVASPVILGSIPTSLTSGWQTLAFSPNPAVGSAHPGLDSPPDHLWLDQFWMPVSEPFPISDQFSTAGKVNLNYAIVPFRYIQRKTALNALMKSIWVSSLPNTAAGDYKSPFFMRQAGTRTRFGIDVEETLLDFDAKFASGDIFRSASQICEMFLAPEGTTLSSAKTSYWTSRNLTSDNQREQPYDALYSRSTTKSNSYTVHWRVQALRKTPGSTPSQWDESRDSDVSELRGSTLIERYINPNETEIPDYAKDNSAESLSQFYKWRTVAENYFQP
jgi:uncharacterized protein (TIGR02600 family)